MPVRVTLLSKPGCHLCDAARDAVNEVIARAGVEASVDEVNILDDAALNQRYWDEIPVVLIEDRVHTIWRVDPDRFAAALKEHSE
ncbi:glutaredoxin [Microbacteriaceae bacterium SG_E_30_P1]|uniref:Glutaredoxin n=1 Tax=Antiquaquibacter oligotrophicus TaxID=2880260 RepID=A0ABT6KPY2_9MICO|nr:glutaredoxin family protein [Antiquaquibacter oligotrophicus]MDH6182046.1 glutaredoxin [Antiquaquibacter oligotrophicus]UDF12286.1 glutaredoxin family protein [Antiquaquibacter oligotrophicus]